MKKLLSALLSLSLSAALLGGCASSSSGSSSASNSETSAATTAATTVTTVETPKAADPVDMNIIALKGPTAMGMVKFMGDVEANEIADNRYNFTIAASVDEVTPKLVQGETDIAAVPANLASVLYNNTKGGVKVLAINTLGVLYIVENGDTVKSVEDLRGKTIYASGKGATPEYALNYILSANGIDPAGDVILEWKSEHAECLAAIASSDNGIALLPQPFVTTAQAKNDKIKVALDLTKEWDALQADAPAPSALITGVVVARTEFIEQNPEAVSAFLEHYKASVDFVNANTSEAAALVEQYDIVPAAVAEKALPACNIAFIDGSAMKEKLSGYLTVLFEQNPKAVGGALPADEFYYNR